MTVTLSRPEDETCEEREAREAIEVVAYDLRRAISRAQADYFEPVTIKIPLSFPKSLDGARLWGLPVERADVREPELVVADHLEHTWWIGWRA